MYIYKLSYQNHVYVGKTKDLRRRLREHYKAARDLNPLLVYKTMREVGITKFKMTKLEEVPNSEIARTREAYYIRKIGTLNMNTSTKVSKIEESLEGLQTQIKIAQELIKKLENFLES